MDELGPYAGGIEATRAKEWARTRRGRHINRILLILGAFFLVVVAVLYAFAWINIGQP